MAWFGSGLRRGLTIPWPCVTGNSPAGGCSPVTAVWTVVITSPCAGAGSTCICGMYTLMVCCQDMHGRPPLSPPRRISPLSPVSATWMTTMVFTEELYSCACRFEITVTSIQHPSFVSRRGNLIQTNADIVINIIIIIQTNVLSLSRRPPAPDQETVANFQHSLRPSPPPFLYPPLPPLSDLVQGVAMSTPAVMSFHSLVQMPIFVQSFRLRFEL